MEILLEQEKRLISCCISNDELQKILLNDFNELDFRDKYAKALYRLIKSTNDDNKKLTYENASEEIIKRSSTNKNISSDDLKILFEITNNIVEKSEYEVLKRKIKGNINKQKLLDKIKRIDVNKSAKDIIDFLEVDKLRGAELQPMLVDTSSFLADCINDIELLYDPELKKKSITTGLKKLDECIIQILPTEMVIMKAEAGVGKTALALNIFANNLVRKRNCLFFSMEMSGTEVFGRLANILANVNLGFTRGGFESELAIKSESDKMMAFAEKMNLLNNWFIIDGKQMKKRDIDEIVALCMYIKEIKNWDKIDLIVIDYLQRVNCVDPKMSEYEKVNYTLDKIQNYCDKENTALIMITSLNAQGQSKGGTTSTFDADLILNLQRSKEYKDALDLTIEKNRHGMLSTIKLARDNGSLKFYEME